MKKIIFILFILLILIILSVGIFQSFYRPLSNISKYIGNADIIAEIYIENKETNKSIILTDIEIIAQFCDIINKLEFEKGDQLLNTNQAKYYIAVTTNTDHFIQTHFPKGHLFRGLKDKGIISPDFELKDLSIFDEWFEITLKNTSD